LKAKKIFEENYDKEIIMKKIVVLFKEVANAKLPNQMSDEEFWDSI
jgi:hypothetical protein